MKTTVRILYAFFWVIPQRLNSENWFLPKDTYTIILKEIQLHVFLKVCTLSQPFIQLLIKPHIRISLIEHQFMLDCM
jgi:hypothetical protein